MNISSMTGRRRVLSDKAMLDICDAYGTGTVSVKTLANRYGVSPNTISSIVYWTPKQAPQAQTTTTRKAKVRK